MEHSDLNREIGERIRVMRERQSKTREKLAEIAHIHISPQFLFDIENGRNSMTARTIIGLACALYVSTDYILLGHTSKSHDIEYLLEGLPNIQNSIILQGFCSTK